MIVVFGATGTIGRRVVSGLVAAGEQVRAFTRDPAGTDFPAPVEVVRGDLEDAAAVQAAVGGAEAVFVLSAGPRTAVHERTVSEAVRAHGTPRVVKLSSVAAMPPVRDSYGAIHAAAEEAVKNSGAEWTILRPAGFMSNVLRWAPSVHAGTVRQPHGRIPRAVVDPADVSDVAVTCLTAPGHAGAIYQLTGPEALTGADLTARLAAALGRPLTFVDLDPGEARQAMIGAGLPEDYATGLVDTLEDPDPNRGGTPLPTVEKLLGRPPVTFDAWLARHLGAFG
ncbi:NAD(P)H-binding protein [Spirillospora sp. NPDC049652]